MLPILALATLAIATPAPITVQFTSDSVYKNESIIQPKEVIEQDNGLYTIVLEEDKLLGYCIYDSNETTYIDGLKFDDNFVTNYTVKDVDLNVEHTIFVKTVYTDDIAGMLAAAKDGDYTALLKNPLTVLQLVYYSIAAISIIIGGFGIFKSKKKKVKDHNEIANAVDLHANEATELLKQNALHIVESFVTPVLTELQTQNQALIEAYMLAQAGDKDSKVALIELLKKNATKDVNAVSNDIIKSIENADLIKQQAKEEAKKLVEDIVDDSTDTVRF